MVASLGTSMSRNLKPRESVAVNVASVSQLTSEAVVGVPGRRYLEIIIPKCRHVACVGNLRVVQLDEVLRVLRELGDDEADETADVVPVVRQPESADAVLALLGKRVASR